MGSNKEVLLPFEDCWFCLANPRIESHLVVALIPSPQENQEQDDDLQLYATCPKGSINEGHLILLPICHYECLLQIVLLSDDLGVLLLKSIRNSLNCIMKEIGDDSIIYERWIMAPNNNNHRESITEHMQLHIVPLDPPQPRQQEWNALINSAIAQQQQQRDYSDMMYHVFQITEKADEVLPFDPLREKLQSIHNNANNGDSTVIITSYLYISFPKQSQRENFLIATTATPQTHHPQQQQQQYKRSRYGQSVTHMPYTFAREIVCRACGLEKEKFDWRTCVKSKEQEIALVHKLRDKYNFKMQPNRLELQ